ncbi:MAG: putative signal transduction histidine kinase [Actinoallomurus sp.]|jgi:anti-sigma regulatory factor (Ser/Thr protein kinase)|nr:putative signal transduction histidine kinase [Actinoallomurus sp.]
MPVSSTSCTSGTDGRLEVRHSPVMTRGTTHGLPPLAAFDPGVQCPDGAVCALRPTGASSRIARDFTSATLRSWGFPELVEDATVIVSELVTNAVRHGLTPDAGTAGERPVRLTLVRNGPFVVCIVADPSDQDPIMRAPDDACEGGRGLHVIEALSRVWGWTPLPGAGKAVWAALAVR